MRYKIIILILILSVCTLNLYPAERPGNTSAQFLRISPSPRAVAMGNAYCSMNEDADTIFFNPASIAFVNPLSISLSYVRWLQEMNYMSLAGVLPVENVGSFGIGAIGLFSGDILETVVVSDNVEETGNSVSAGEYCFIGSYGRKIVDFFSAGINIKGIFQNLENESAGSFAIDLGVLFLFDEDRLKAGLALQNIGSRAKFVENGSSLPLNMRLGVNYSIIIDPKNKLLLITEAQKTFYEDLSIGGGFEYAFNNLIFGRAGYEYQNNSDSLGFKAGIGFNIKNIKINYGFDLFNTLGTTHFVQVNIPVGTSKKESTRIAAKRKEFDMLDSADIYILNNEYENALPIYKEIIQMNPGHIRASYNMACIYSVLNDIDNAKIWLNYTLNLDSSRAMLNRIEKDADLSNLRNSTAYDGIMNKSRAPKARILKPKVSEVKASEAKEPQTKAPEAKAPETESPGPKLPGTIEDNPDLQYSPPGE